MTDVLLDCRHVPVLAQEAVNALNLCPDGVVVDATYGRGGHARRILPRLGAHARMVVIDRDVDAISHAQQQFECDRRVEIVHAPFSELGRILHNRELAGRVTAMLFDLGMCSTQLEQSQRGFSFSRDGPLDMRMDCSRGETAADWLQRVDEAVLAGVLRQFGEERFARRIAGRIVARRKTVRLATTTQLAQLVTAAVPVRGRGKHPATRTFQAIRIALNNELAELEAVLPQALGGLAAGGRLAVISFHSLEDRLVKRFFRAQSRGDPYPPDFPVTDNMLKPRLKLVSKAVTASAVELAANPRARSAVLRVAEKLAS